MSNNDLLAACLSKINNADKVHKNEVEVLGTSNMIKNVLALLKKNNYVGDASYDDADPRGYAKITLLSHINKCGAIKPRFNVKVNDYEKFEQRFLPAKGFGVLIVSTPQGLMTNKEAKEKNEGGKLIAFCY